MLRILTALPLLGVVAASISVCLQWHQDDLDHRLIQAIKLRKTDKAMSLLNLAASANAQDNPNKPMTLRIAMSDLWASLHGRVPPKEPHPSALMLECSASVEPNASNEFEARPTDLALMSALLSHGARPNLWDPVHSATALDFLIMAGNTEAVKLFLEHGCSSNWKSPLTSAVMYKRDDIASLLLHYGADIGVQTTNGTTVLHWAALDADDGTPMLEVLLSHKADINARDKDGRTPLMYAVDAGPENVRFLLLRGADPSIQDRKGQTALHLARSRRDSPDKRGVVRLLTEAEAAKPIRR
jgi:ankyrin repeat protein